MPRDAALRSRDSRQAESQRLLGWRVLDSVRSAAIIAAHLALFASASYAAYWLRFDGELPVKAFANWKALLPAIVLTEAVFFSACGLYSGLWRYTGLWDLKNLACATLASTVVIFVVVQWHYAELLLPRSTYILNALLLMFMAGGIRILPRLYWQLPSAAHYKSPSGKRTLIVGAGDAGEMVVRAMIRRELRNKPIGFVDDDAQKVGRRIHGVKVLGTCLELRDIMTRLRPDEVLVPSGNPAALRGVISALESFKVPVKMLPNLRDLVDGRVTVADFRPVSLEDLLRRAPVGLNGLGLGDLITGKRLVVTGAGGSIGSELCRQIAVLDPSSMVLVERYENSLYAIENELREGQHALSLFAAIGDVSDANRMNELFAQYQPQIVFHAAAHKHVPLMELNPCEAVKNNVHGTRVTAEAAVAHGVDLFVLISTDKAVNPTSIMGATKRIGELIVQAMAANNGTRFVAVRFGNVLGSNGSVIPRFFEQIRNGGPVTVTHPSMRRFFMLIPEAVQLVLHAASLGENGSIYVLDMGDQIKVVDVACNAIRLAGHIPYDEIPIVFTGVRPGEKLFEELVGADESVTPSRVDKIFKVQSRKLRDPASIKEAIVELEVLSQSGDSKQLVNLLRELIPSFQSLHPDEADLTNSHLVTVETPIGAALHSWEPQIDGRRGKIDDDSPFRPEVLDFSPHSNLKDS